MLHILIINNNNICYMDKQQGLDKALFALIQTNDFVAAKYLIGPNANVNCIVENKSLIWHAVLKNNFDQTKFLIENKADVNTKYKGDTLLIYAVYFGYTEIVKLLLDTECDHTIPNDRGDNIFHLASAKPNQEIFKILLKKFPQMDVNLYDSCGCSLLYNVVSCTNDTETIKILFSMKADPNIKNKLRPWYTPIEACNHNCKKNIVELFLQHPDIDINSTSEVIKKYIAAKERASMVFNKDGKSYPLIKSNKPLFTVEALCDEIPLSILITIPENTSVDCVNWNAKEETWTKQTILHTEKYTIEIIANGKIRYHNHPDLGYIQFDQLTMPDGTVKTRDDIYH